MMMRTKFLALLAGVAMLGGVSAANAMEPLSNAQLDGISAGWGAASAGAFANATVSSNPIVAFFQFSYSATETSAVVVDGLGSQSQSVSFARVRPYNPFNPD
jgi:hypothetical protein